MIPNKYGAPLFTRLAKITVKTSILPKRYPEKNLQVYQPEKREYQYMLELPTVEEYIRRKYVKFNHSLSQLHRDVQNRGGRNFTITIKLLDVKFIF